MTVKDFFSLEPETVFQQGLFTFKSELCRYIFVKGHGNDWAGYYLPAFDDRDIKIHGHKMSYAQIKPLSIKELVNLYRL